MCLNSMPQRQLQRSWLPSTNSIKIQASMGFWFNCLCLTISILDWCSIGSIRSRMSTHSRPRTLGSWPKAAPVSCPARLMVCSSCLPERASRSAENRSSWLAEVISWASPWSTCVFKRLDRADRAMPMQPLHVVTARLGIYLRLPNRPTCYWWRSENPIS